MELQPGTEQTEGAEANIDRDDADLVFCKHEGIDQDLQDEITVIE